MIRITLTVGAWTWSVYLEEGGGSSTETLPILCGTLNARAPGPGEMLLLAMAFIPTLTFTPPPTPKLLFLFMKRPGSKRPMTTLGSPFLYLNISKHLAETFIFSLPQGEEVIRENGTNIPICQKQEGSELKGKFYHLTEQNQPRREYWGLFHHPIHPVCFLQCNFRNLITEKMAPGQNQVSILPRINHSPAAPAQETLPSHPESQPK